MARPGQGCHAPKNFCYEDTTFEPNQGVSGRMNAPKMNINWAELELDVGRLFSAAPLLHERLRDRKHQDSLYPGRASEVRLMMNAVRDPAKHILLYGERGLGKTSLSNTFWQSSDAFLSPVFAARVQADPSDDFSSLWRRALTEVQEATRHHNISIRSDLEHVTPDIARREFQKLPQNWQFIVVVDEFDLLRDRSARELTAHLLKLLHDYSVNVTIILIGVADNVEELILNHQSLRRVLLLIKLERMNILDLTKILDSRLQSIPLQLSDDARSEILALSCGLPYYIQTLGKSAAQNSIMRQHTLIEVEDVDAAIARFLLESGQSFSYDYQKATDSRAAGNIFHKVLLASALARADTSGFFEPSEVVKAFNFVMPNNIFHYSRISQYLSQFTTDKRGRIMSREGTKGNYRYRFSDALMQPFVLMRAIKGKMIDQGVRRSLFHLGKGQLLDQGCRLGISEADTVQIGIVSPTLMDARSGTSEKTRGPDVKGNFAN